MPDAFGQFTQEEMDAHNQNLMAQNFPDQQSPVQAPLAEPAYPADAPLAAPIQAPLAAPVPGPEPVAPEGISQPPLPPGLPAGYQQPNVNTIEALQGQQETVQDQQGFLQDQADASNEADMERARVFQESAEEKQLLADERDAEVNEAITSRKAMMDQYNKMSIKDYWSDKPTWSKIASLIGITLGAYGAAMSKTKNSALAIMNKAMDDDYARQKSAIDKQFQLIQSKRGDTAELRKLYADKMEGLKFKEVAKLEKLKGHILLKTGNLRNEKARIEGQKVADLLDLKIGSAKDDAVSDINEILAKQQFEKQREASRDRGRQASRQIGWTEKQEYKKRERREEETRLTGQIGDYAKDPGAKVRPADASKLKEAVAVKGEMDLIVDNLQELIDSHGSFEFGGQGGAEMLANQRRLVMALKEFDRLGVLTGPDMGLLTSQVNDPESLKAMFTRDSTAKQKLRSFKQLLEDKFSSRMSAFGYKKSAKQPEQPAQSEIDPEDKKAFEWAQKNPDDPRANAIIEKVRAKYGR